MKCHLTCENMVKLEHIFLYISPTKISGKIYTLAPKNTLNDIRIAKNDGPEFLQCQSSTLCTFIMVD